MLLTDRRVAPGSLSETNTYLGDLFMYKKGDIIPTDKEGLWQVYRGIIQLSKVDFEGEEIVLGWALPDTCFGKGINQRTEYQAVALSDVYLKWCSVEDINNSNYLCRNLLMQQSRRLTKTEEILSIIAIRRVEERLWQLILFLSQEIGHPVPEGIRLGVRFTHQNLANVICTTRVTVTRLLGEFQDKGLITFDSSRHIILNNVEYASPYRF
ncbi:MAG: Crp/Fnr family transcriptional regulator [Cyanobacteria bacterium J083]|nr:MAG: Crp/Fnr family transcriptional regulator [Cyanobacteria bacterium J083]